MYSLAFLAAASFLLALLLTPSLRDLATRLGAVDRPDHVRKIHARPVPRIGGLAIVLAVVFAFAGLFLSPLGASRIVAAQLPAAVALLPALLVMFATGLADDLYGLRPWQKLAGQIAAAGLACSAEVNITGVAYHPLNHWLGVPVTIVWLVGCANALNLIDGSDGLAAGLGLFATLTCFAAALLHGDYTLMLATAPLAGALLGLLRYNFPPASIFLGDSGSLTIGFLLGCYGIVWSQKSATLLGLTAPLMALAIPLLDTALAIVRRFLRGQPIFAADSGHIHHRLLARGLTPRRVALLLYAGGGVAALFSLVQTVASRSFAGPITVLFGVLAWLGIRRLGYVELNLFGRLARPDTFRRVLVSQLQLHALEDALARARTVEESWLALRSACFGFGFSELSLELDHTLYREVRADCRAAHGWSLRIPLSESESVTLGCDFQEPLEPLLVAPLALVLRRSLGERSVCARVSCGPTRGDCQPIESGAQKAPARARWAATRAG